MSKFKNNTSFTAWQFEGHLVYWQEQVKVIFLIRKTCREQTINSGVSTVKEVVRFRGDEINKVPYHLQFNTGSLIHNQTNYIINDTS